jgi:hypothetical protein
MDRDQVVLEVCPFCGKEAKVEWGDDHHGDYFSMGCPDQNCAGYLLFYTFSEDDFEDCVTKWNRRA